VCVASVRAAGEISSLVEVQVCGVDEETGVIYGLSCEKNVAWGSCFKACKRNEIALIAIDPKATANVLDF
jgi:hypothetical protein